MLRLRQVSNFLCIKLFGFKLFTGAAEESGVLSAGLIRGILQCECGDSRVPQLPLLTTSLCRLYI